MSPKGVLVLATLTLGAVALAAHAVMQRDLPITSVAVDEPLLPGLAERLAEVATIAVTTEGRKTTVRRTERGWVVEELDGFPVDPTKVQSLARSLVTARLLEPKTDRPERWARLELDADNAKSRARSVVLEDAQGRAIASVVVGKTRYGAFGPGRGAVYVRRGDEPRAWLADRRIEVPAEPLDWVDRQILDIPREAIASVTLRPGTGEEVVIAKPSREAQELVLDQVPGGRAADKDKVERLASTLSGLSLQDVRAAGEVPFAQDAPRARFATVDGVVVEAVVHKEGEGDDASFWVRFAAQTGEPLPGQPAEGTKPAAEQVAQLAPRLDGWAFKLSRWSAERLVWTRDDLLQPADKTS
ncbi:MAG: DUF4340 domain-containing protein [Geminicoccaceae bacterium]|nr:DUF4340 domain-containing protein [Geminicoccaceae bacterium]